MLSLFVSWIGGIVSVQRIKYSIIELARLTKLIGSLYRIRPRSREHIFQSSGEYDLLLGSASTGTRLTQEHDHPGPACTGLWGTGLGKRIIPIGELSRSEKNLW